MMHKAWGIALFAMSVLAAPGVAADTPQQWPDPATVTVPDLAFNPRDAGDPDDYFIFHKAGVDFATALADFSECSTYTADLDPFAHTPEFLPLGGSPGPLPPGPYTGPMGMPPSLPGAIAVLLLSSLIGDGVTDDFVNANLRKCMGYKSYARYGTTKAIWKKITAGTPAVIATRMALIASGPQPQTGVLAP